MTCLTPTCVYRDHTRQCTLHTGDPLVVVRDCSRYEMRGERIFQMAVEKNIVREEETTSPFVQYGDGTGR